MANTSRVVAQVLMAAGSLSLLGAMAQKTFQHVAEHSDQLPKLTSPDATTNDIIRRAKKYPMEFERFFDTKIGWREIQIRRFGRYKLGWFGVSPTPRVILGDDGWLFYNQNVEPTYIPANDPRIAARLNEWATTMPIWHAWLAQRNIKLLFVIVPDKQSVFPEHLPAHLRKARSADSPLDRLMKAYHESGQPVEVLDLRDDMVVAKSIGQVYFKSDTHWTLIGARAGYQATARRLGFVPSPDDDFKLVERPAKDGDLARIMLGDQYKSSELFDDLQLKAPTAQLTDWHGADDGSRLDYLKARAWKRPGGTGKCLLFHDSYGDFYYAKLLAEHFGELVSLPSNHLDPKLIEAEKPDVLVMELAERLLQATEPRKPSEPPRRSVTK